MVWNRALGCLAAVLLACGDGGDDSDTSSTSTTLVTGTSGDVPTTGGATTGAGVAEWDECTQIAVVPPEVSQTAAVGIIPQAVGGTIADGVYVLTSYEVFAAAGLTPDGVSGVLRFDGAGYQRGSLDDAASGTFSTAGAELSFTAACTCTAGGCDMTAQAPATQPYTAFEGTVLLFSDYVNGGTALATYTLR